MPTTGDHRYRVKNDRVRVATSYPTPTLTKQSFRDECDVNMIVRKFERTGELPVGPAAATYADVSNTPDFQNQMDRIAHVRSEFDDLEVHQKMAFNNDPEQLLAALDDPNQLGLLRDLGLVEGEAEPKPTPPVPTASPEAPTPESEPPDSSPS